MPFTTTVKVPSILTKTTLKLVSNWTEKKNAQEKEIEEMCGTSATSTTFKAFKTGCVTNERHEKAKCSPEKFLHQDSSHQQFGKRFNRTF